MNVAGCINCYRLGLIPAVPEASNQEGMWTTTIPEGRLPVPSATVRPVNSSQFTGMTRTIRRQSISSFPYINDWRVVSTSEKGQRRDKASYSSLLESLGWLINREGSASVKPDLSRSQTGDAHRKSVPDRAESGADAPVVVRTDVRTRGPGQIMASTVGKQGEFSRDSRLMQTPEETTTRASPKPLKPEDRPSDEVSPRS